MESLKSAFRVISFIKPNYRFIAEAFLYLNGFQSFKKLSLILIKSLELVEEKLNIRLILA